MCGLTLLIFFYNFCLFLWRLWCAPAKCLRVLKASRPNACASTISNTRTRILRIAGECSTSVVILRTEVRGRLRHLVCIKNRALALLRLAPLPGELLPLYFLLLDGVFELLLPLLELFIEMRVHILIVLR